MPALARMPSNQRLHLARAPSVMFALDCSRNLIGRPAAPVIERGRCRAGETLIR
jgi:hypothetical protein